MRADVKRLASRRWTGLCVVLSGFALCAGARAGSAPFLPPAPPAATIPVPFAPAGPFRLDEASPTPFVDVTGSIGASATASTPLDAVPHAPPPFGLGIEPPDLPLPPLLAQGGEVKAAIRAELGRIAAEAPAPTASARRRQADAIAAFYESRDAAPLWLDGTHFSAGARAAIARLDRAAEDGLSLSAFAVPVLRDPTPADLARAELALSEAVVAYAGQARGARVDPQQVNRLITAKRTLESAPDILAAVSAAADPGAALHAYNPPQPGYAALRAKLAEVRQAAPQARSGIPSGPTLKLGMRDPRVPLIRSRFGLGAGEPRADDLVYDIKVAAAVADFQRQSGLPASGSLTARTVAALSGGEPARLENELIANMERWRWLPRDLGSDHILVNVPDFTLDVVQGGSVVHHARVVVGRPDHQTPIFSDAMRFIIVNPYWNVPLSIIEKEMMPKLAADPNYFADHGYEVVERDGQMIVRQPPGDDNALGRIKFMFPNEHSVYLHDTNARALFGKDKRALSHGCVRVDQPFRLAEVLLGPANGWNEARIRKMVGGKERTVTLPQPLPIHIAYFTAFTDASGALQLRDDIYGYSEKVRSALGLHD